MPFLIIQQRNRRGTLISFKLLYFISVLLLSYSAVIAQNTTITTPFDSSLISTEPNYNLKECWAALPFTKDYSDTCIGNCIYTEEAKSVDVFFIHPTSYTEKPTSKNYWNGDVYDLKLNQSTNHGSIRYQASVFNRDANVFAPYYRQAHYFSYITADTASARLAFELAYSDVKKAFQFYLEHYNLGKPIIIASHSQGTNHAIRLLKEFFDNKPLQSRLVCAYLIGMPVYDSLYSQLKPCKNASETNCYCTWRTYAVGYFPENYAKPQNYPVCTNPLLWTINSNYAPSNLNLGGVLRDMKTVVPKICDAQVEDGVLRINKPNFRGSMFLRIKNYHIADYNLFYMNIRENVRQRISNFK